MKKILIISTISTPPILLGNQKCIFEYCELLKSLGCEVHFLYVEGRIKPCTQLFSYWRNNLHIYKKKLWIEAIKRAFVRIREKLSGFNHVDDLFPIGLTMYVKDLQEQYNFDAIIINYVYLSKLFCSNLKCKSILFAHDCMSLKKLRSGERNLLYDLHPSEEAKGLQRCDIVLSIQENESIYFKYLHPHGKVVTVFSSFQIKKPSIKNNNNILFLSGTSNLNVLGINYFINEVFPLILSKVPEAKLLIGGSICDVIKVTNNDNIKLVGKFENEDDFYNLGDVVINPVCNGSGLKIKTFEALAYGKVLVVHPHSAEGIYDAKNAPLFIGNNTMEFANKTVEVMTNKELRDKYSRLALEYSASLKAFVKEQYKTLICNEK